MIRGIEKIQDKILFIDIDETICHLADEHKTGELDYNYSVPLRDRIDMVNELYKRNRVVMFTARGARTGKEWKEFTAKQLDAWGVDYHELRFDKPHYDMMVCDKAVNDFGQLVEFMVEAKPRVVSVEERLPEMMRYVGTIDEDGQCFVYRRVAIDVAGYHNTWCWNLRDVPGDNAPSDNKRILYWLDS